VKFGGHEKERKMGNNNPGTQIAGGEFNTSTRIFEKYLPEEPCGCRQVEWVILYGATGQTVVRKRIAAHADCPHGHNLRSKIVQSRSDR